MSIGSICKPRDRDSYLRRSLKLAPNEEVFVDRECEEFIGCPPGRGIRAGISGSDRMLLGPKATEAASNKVN